MPEAVEYVGVFGGNTDFMEQEQDRGYAPVKRSMAFLASDQDYAEMERGISFGSFAAMACEEIEEIAPARAAHHL